MRSAIFWSRRSTLVKNVGAEPSSMPGYKRFSHLRSQRLLAMFMASPTCFSMMLAEFVAKFKDGF
jgi:hypothetical protein